MQTPRFPPRLKLSLLQSADSSPTPTSRLKSPRILQLPTWTPLFAMASAVVTDIGGPLSHGSIVAREYGIPAVLGTAVATRRIHDGQTITVDGGKGTVTVGAALKTIG